MTKLRRPLWLLALAVLAFMPAHAGDEQRAAQAAAHMLDYVSVDYPGAVQNGKVIEPDEYQEQVEFAGQVATLLQSLPEKPEKARLLADADALVRLIAQKAAGEQVGRAASNLRWAIVTAYQISVAPKIAPDLARGQALYRQYCVSCHGVNGRGDGPAATTLDPKPSNFHDRARMAQRSAYGLYNTISLGVGGTGMASYPQLGEDERWALAFYVSRFAISETELAKGEAAWTSGAHGKVLADLRTVVTLSTDEVKTRHGTEAALAHLWLRAHPQALAAGKPSPIRFTIDTLRESLAAYAQGERSAAQQLAVTAYLEGFELVEATLDNVDADLRVEIEREMIAHRSLLKSGASVDAVRAQMNRIIDLLDAAQAKLDREVLSPGATFTASLVILLREGLEAILVLAAIVTFLIKSGRRDALPWVHVGWASALALGVITWLLATYVVGISGANREITEGATALIAAAMLLYVGLWMHSKAYARAWQRFIRDRVGAALEKRTLWTMAAVAFLAVYRELFEIVLFYQALWAQAGTGGGAPLLGGIGMAAALLAAIGWAIFRYGLRLPVAPFFTVTAILLAALAVVFAGNGVAALQEAGVVDATPVNFVRLPVLGIYPTIQTLGAQVAVILSLAAGFYLVSRSQPGVSST